MVTNCSGSKQFDNLGVFLVSSQSFKCCFRNAKRSFYMAFNAIFGKVGRMASEDVILSLIESKCLPAMFYGLEACPVNSSQINSLEFSLTSTLMKTFSTRSKEIVTECMQMFDFQTVKAAVKKRKVRFLTKYCFDNNNLLCSLFVDVALQELDTLSLM